jgi:hypothetical protein
MPALLRPTLRSSSRKKTSLGEVPPTDTQQNPLPKHRRGKRTREHSLDNLSNASVKKQKSSPPKQSEQPQGAAEGQSGKSLPLRDKPGTKDAVTSRPPGSDRSQQRINGNPTATQHLNGSTFGTHNLLVSTTTTLLPTDKRSLRSHDGGSRSKSELALYFPNYDELVSIEPKEPGKSHIVPLLSQLLTLPDFLTSDTILHITDEPLNGKLTTTSSHSSRTNPINKIRFYSSSHPTTPNGSSHTLELSETAFTNLNNATRINISAIDNSARNQKDPLTDAFYHKAHRKAERQEKQLRNIEKERAMHEKVQLERLMDGLKGHDWLRVMGISGITDGEKKAYEPKRDYFISEVRVLLKKFQEWKEEEKRRKVDKEESMQDEDEERDEDDEGSSTESDGDPPNLSDVDASAARQLRQEATSATKAPSAQVRLHRKKEPTGPAVQKPFTSFYSKPYLRDAAIGKHRRGRAKFAFGQPLPEPPDQEFNLGIDILTPDTLAAQERKRRASVRHTD